MPSNMLLIPCHVLSRGLPKAHLNSYQPKTISPKINYSTLSRVVLPHLPTRIELLLPIINNTQAITSTEDPTAKPHGPAEHESVIAASS